MPALLKHALQIAGDTALLSRFVSLVERVHQACDNHLQVLTYHRIDEPEARPDLAPSTLSATPPIFRQQMAHLARRYRVVSLAEVMAACRGESRLPPRAVLLTFDDAYQDFAEHAWPILRRFGLPATLFVPTAYPNHPQRVFWWDRLYHAIANANVRQPFQFPWGTFDLSTSSARKHAYQQSVVWIKSVPHELAMRCVEQVAQQLQTPRAVSHMLSWDALRRLSAEGVAIGAHTQTHPLMHRISPERAFIEVAGSLADLRREIHGAWSVFAYPGGTFSAAAVGAVRAVGFELAFATRRGINDIRHLDPLRIRRNHIGMGTTRAIFQFRLLPWSIHFNRWRPVTGQ